MVADVRLKVRMRIRSALQVMRLAVGGFPELDARFGLTVDEYTVKPKRKAAVMVSMGRVVPGCSITVLRDHITVRLPDRYPNPHIPVIVELDWWWKNYLRGHGWEVKNLTNIAIYQEREERLRRVLNDETPSTARPASSDDPAPF